MPLQWVRTKESATDALQQYEGGKLMASVIVDFKSREGPCPVNHIQPRSKRDSDGMGKGYTVFFNDWTVRISSPERGVDLGHSRGWAKRKTI